MWAAPRDADGIGEIVETVDATAWRDDLEARVAVRASYSPRTTQDVVDVVESVDALGYEDAQEAQLVEQQLGN